MKSMMNFEKYSKYFFILMLTIGLASCEDDDDGTDPETMPDPTGNITANDQALSNNNTITVQSVTVGQDSWLVAVNQGDESTDNFVSDPVFLQSGTNSDVEITLNGNADITGGEEGSQISLKLYADNPTEGTQNEWDMNDDPIFENGVLATETITVMTEQTSDRAFAEYDLDGDGNLDEDEFVNTYENDFTGWDADADGSLNDEEFANTTFGNTDADNDDAISEDEWNTGYSSMYGNYAEEGDFATFDADADGTINSDEWNTGFAESGWYEAYDADANSAVSEDEWNTGLFGDWDTDQDGGINEDEYNNYSGYSGSWANTGDTTAA